MIPSDRESKSRSDRDDNGDAKYLCVSCGKKVPARFWNKIEGKCIDCAYIETEIRPNS